MEVLPAGELSDHTSVFKGKRSKRPRPLSPVSVAVTPVTSSSSTGGATATGGGGSDVNSSLFQYSPTTSTTKISNSSDEDEDMANCLILLAQSGCRKEKTSRRKITEMAGAGAGKADVFVYECKTCNRTFPSFQALGGHRASHKKPKIMVNSSSASASVSPLMGDHDHDLDDHQEQGKDKKVISYGKNKIHECSICGSDFPSGQALGGHMRRHRPPTTSSYDDASVLSEKEKEKKKTMMTKNINLPFDLNLPAPPEDDNQSTKFDLSANYQQSLVFSSMSLVDCHY